MLSKWCRQFPEQQSMSGISCESLRTMHRCKLSVFLVFQRHCTSDGSWINLVPIDISAGLFTKVSVQMGEKKSNCNPKQWCSTLTITVTKKTHFYVYLSEGPKIQSWTNSRTQNLGPTIIDQLFKHLLPQEQNRIEKLEKQQENVMDKLFEASEGMGQTVAREATTQPTRNWGVNLFNTFIDHHKKATSRRRRNKRLSFELTGQQCQN